MNFLSGKFNRKISIIFVCLSALAAFVPFTPEMPTYGLDPSWYFAINQAFSQDLVFGKDVVFTFGPYASIYTMTYHPAAEIVMMGGGLFLALCYIAVLLFLSRKTSFYWLLTYSILLAFFMASRDALLFSYPFLLALVSYRIALPIKHAYKIELSRITSIIFSFLFSPLGLLPLIKSSMILVSTVTIVLCFSIFILTKHTRLAFIALLLPLLSTVIFWIIAKQPLISLPDFFISADQIISGYTEAMSLPRKYHYIILYLLVSFMMLRSILKIEVVTSKFRMFLFITYAAFFFIAFKAGLVRNDSAHAYIAGTMLFFALLSLFCITKIKPSWVLIALSVLSFLVIGRSHSLHNAYLSTWRGIQWRLSTSNILRQSFDDHINLIKKEYTIPTLQGTVDIYPYDQSYLLASNNSWSPRPVVQSYSAYTPALAILDVNHLIGGNAPDNIIFRVATIDDRLPALDDGASWPILLSHYEFMQKDGRFAYLKRRLYPLITTQTTLLPNLRIQKINALIVLPDYNKLLFAKINIELTLLGKLLAFLYVPPPLDITLYLDSGEVKTYRIISGMTKSGFVLSPLIENTNDFLDLMSPQEKNTLKRVKSIIICPRWGGAFFWNNTYTLQISSLN